MPASGRNPAVVSCGLDAGFAALRAWIAESGEHKSGELREIYLDCDGPRETWVVELQLALASRG